MPVSVGTSPSKSSPTPRTEESARKNRYNVGESNPSGAPYQPEKCAMELDSGFVRFQCPCIRGHGPEGLYCFGHSMLARFRPR